jgi:hypothetical protein
MLRLTTDNQKGPTMIINETTLRALCARVAAGDEEARRDFDSHVSPLVETIVGRWLSHQRQKDHAAHAADVSAAEPMPLAGRSAELLAKVTAAVCARMIAQAADDTRPRGLRQVKPPAFAPATRETVFAHAERSTVHRLAPGPA